MSNTITNDVQNGGKKESLFQKSTNLNLHLDKFAIINSNRQVSIKCTNTREYNNLKDNLKTLMNFEHSVKIINSEIEKNTKRDKNKEDELKRQFNDLTYIIEAKYKNGVGIEKTKDNKIKILNKQPKKLNSNSEYIFLDNLKDDLKSFNDEVHNLKRLLKQENQLSDSNKEYLDKVLFQRNLIQLLDIKKVNTKHQKEEFYKKAYDTLISFQEQNYNFKINDRDKSKQVYNFVQHKIKDTKIKLTNDSEIKLNVEKLYRALDFNSKHTKEQVIESFKRNHLYNVDYINDKTKDIVNMLNNNKYDFRNDLDKELKKLKVDVNNGVDLKSWANKTIENRGVSKDLTKDFKHKLNNEVYKDFTNNRIEIVNQELDKRMIELAKTNDYEEITKLAQLKVNVYDKNEKFANRMKNLNKELKELANNKIEIVIEKDNVIVDSFKVSKDEKIIVKETKIEQSETIKKLSDDFVNSILDDTNDFIPKKALKYREELNKVDLKKVDTTNIKTIKTTIDIKEQRLRSITILSKLEKLYKLNKPNDLINWQTKVKTFENDYSKYTNTLKIKLNENYIEQYKHITKEEDKLTYINFDKATLEDIKNLNVEHIDRIEENNEVLIYNENDDFESKHHNRK